MPDLILGSVLRLAGQAMPGLEADSRVISFVLSDSSVARDDHTIMTSGWDYKAYMTNPVVLFAHDADDVNCVIGRMERIWTDGDSLMGDISFIPADINPMAETVYQMVRAGYLNAVSVGFIPRQAKPANDRSRPGGYDVTRAELLEVSVVPVPALPSALATARAAGIDTGPIYSWAEKIMASRAADPKWKVGASRDIPLSAADSFDADAAAERMLDAAGIGNDGSDPVKARRGFLVYDDAKPNDRASYRFPFADIVDGDVKAVPDGIRAAAASLSEAGFPQDVHGRARALVEHYEARMMKDEKPEAARPEVKRSLGHVSWLACILQELGCLEDSAAFEAMTEGEPGEASAGLAAAIKVLGETLLAMTAEEIADMVEEESAEDVARARKFFAAFRDADARHIELVTAAGDRLAEGHDLTVVDRTAEPTTAVPSTRAGRILSSQNEEALRSAHKMLSDAADMVMTVVSQVPGEQGQPDMPGPDVEARAIRARKAKARSYIN